MLDSGGGTGGGGGTPWHALSIEDMWTWVNRDLSPHYQQANSWKKTSELYGLYALRLQTFRDRLAQAWNPKNSPAAQVYLTRLDELITAVKDVDEVAGRNYQASVDIPNAISEAKYKLKPIYDAYKSAASTFAKEGGSGTQGSYANTTASSTPEAKAAAELVNMKHYAAQSVMYKLSEDLSRSRSSLGRPEPYHPPGVEETDETNNDYRGSTVAPPMIPPVIPAGPPPGPMPSGPTSTMPIPKGPDLSGLQPGPGPGPGPGLSPAPFPTPTGPTPPGPGPSPFPPNGIINPPSPGLPGAPPPGPRPGTGPLPPGGLGSTPPRPTGPTGMIGSQPPSGRSPAGVRGPNPAGGLIGGGSGAAGRGPAGAGGVPGRGPAGPGVAGPGGRGVPGAPGVSSLGGRAGTAGGAGGVAGRGGVAAGGVGGAAGRGPAGTAGVAGGRGGAAGRAGMAGAMGIGGRGGHGHDEDGEHYDPDTAWEVAQGVTPVLDAPEFQRPIDPGPAIGLD